MAELKVHRPRPRKLSDPHSEFIGDDADKLLAIPDRKLEWNHFRDILGPFTPAGTYEEVVYFLPLAFDYLIAIEEHALDLVTTPVWFASEYDEQLRKVRIRNPVRQRIRDCLSHWTREFKIIHLDRHACREKGWVILYEDLVQSCEVICQCTDDLVRFKNHADLAFEFFQSLRLHEDNATKAAWLLELARACSDVYTPPNDPEIRGLLLDSDHLRNAKSVVEQHRFEFDPSPTYWNDTFTTLGL